MAYIQKIVPADVPMLQLPKGYDVISYRVEYVPTAENPTHYEEIEREIMDNAGYYIPGKYLAKYFYGPRIEPFIRIYRTIAPHSEVEKYLNSGGDPLTLFRKKDIEEKIEEACYTSLKVPDNYELGFKFDFADFDFNSTVAEDKRRQAAKESAYRREFELTFAPKLKNLSKKFMTKCLEIDDFFEDVEKFIVDPADFHREDIMKRAIMLEPNFELCESLDPQLPDGFAEKTSSLSKNKILEILSVVEVLKWQVGIVKKVDDKIWKNKFYTKDVLWSSKVESLINNKGNNEYLSEGNAQFGVELGYMLKEIATREEKIRVIPSDVIYTDTLDNHLTSEFTNLMQVNPHKHKYYYDTLSSDNEKGFGYFAANYLFNHRSIKDHFRGKENEPQHNRIMDLLAKNEDLTEEEHRELLRTFIRLSKNVLLKYLDKYPSFLKERLLDLDNYPGEIFRLDLRKEDKIEEYVEFFDEEVFYKIDPENGDSWDSAAVISFDTTYLADYSDLMAYAGEIESNGLSVYEALNKIQNFDPDDTIASRFLAEFAYKEINKGALSDLWNKFFGKKIYEESEKEEDPAEVMAVKAFKIYRRTLKQLVKMLDLASSVDPTITMFDKQGNLPGLADSVKEYLLNKVFSYSRTFVSKAFTRDANEAGMDTWKYIPLQNEDARIIRNKFSHGVDISEQELNRFISFCSKITDIAEETTKAIENEKKKNREGKQEQ